MEKITNLVIHHSVSPKITDIQQISNWHKNRNWGTSSNPVYAKKSALGSYCQYHYFLNDNGFRQGRKENEPGWHSGNWKVNNSSIAICVAGNYEKEKVEKKTLERLRKKILHLKKKYNVPNSRITGHGDVPKNKPTACPGKNLVSYIRGDYWAKRPPQKPPKPPQCTKEQKLNKSLRKENKLLKTTISVYNKEQENFAKYKKKVVKIISENQQFKNDNNLSKNKIIKLEKEIVDMKLKIENVGKERKDWEFKAKRRKKLLNEMKQEKEECQIKLEKSWTSERELKQKIEELENKIVPESGRFIFEFGEYLLFKKKVKK